MSEFGFIGDTYNTAIARVRRTPEPTVITPDNQPCNPTTRGIVQPAPTNASGVALIGRESRRWRNHTPHGKPDHITYKHPDAWPHHLATLRDLANGFGQLRLAKAIGISERTIRNLLNGRSASHDTRPKGHRVPVSVGARRDWARGGGAVVAGRGRGRSIWRWRRGRLTPPTSPPPS